MRNIYGFIQKERLYILLLIFVILVNAIVILHDRQTSKDKGKAKESSASIKAGLGLRDEEIRKVLEQKKDLNLLFTAASLVILLVLFLGIAIDLVLASLGLAKKHINMLTYKLHTVKWNVWDVCRVVILFLFFGYMLVMIESALAKVLPVVKNDNLRMVINSSILDTITVVFILYFTVRQYKEMPVSLGLSFRNFFKNIFYGIMGYIAAAPILLAILIGISAVTNLIHYVPKEQAVVRLFLKEENTTFLFCTTLFASIFGPMIEEVFFRGFMYNAFKKYVGIFWAAVVTAVIFAGLHAHAVGFLPIMALGLLLVYLYEKTGTLVAPMTVHIMHNLGMVLMVLLIKQIK